MAAGYPAAAVGVQLSDSAYVRSLGTKASVAVKDRQESSACGHWWRIYAAARPAALSQHADIGDRGMKAAAVIDRGQAKGACGHRVLAVLLPRLMRLASKSGAHAGIGKQ